MCVHACICISYPLADVSLVYYMQKSTRFELSEVHMYVVLTLVLSSPFLFLYCTVPLFVSRACAQLIKHCAMKMYGGVEA
jgi:hypothetical protein